MRSLPISAPHEILLGDQIANEMGGARSMYGERKCEYRVLVGKHQGKGPVGRSERRWKDNINMDHQELGWGGMDWINLAQDKGQVAGTCKCGNEPSGSIKCGKFSG